MLSIRLCILRSGLVWSCWRCVISSSGVLPVNCRNLAKLRRYRSVVALSFDASSVFQYSNAGEVMCSVAELLCNVASFGLASWL